MLRSFAAPLLLPLLMLAAPPVPAAEAPRPEASASPAPDKEKSPEGKLSVTRHSVHAGGTVVAYTATAGTLLMKNDKDEPVALFGFTAYVKDGADPHTRPIVFAYNGGPGSASVWLHMGILGPRRTVLTDLEANTRGPFRTVENEYSILDLADLVMIDPVGTGFSRPVGKGEGKDFWGVDQDIESVSDFILQYLGKYGRWASPKFVLGESYGGIRTGGVAYHLLARHSVALNGVILVSPYMDFVAGNAGLKLDLPYVNYLPAYAAVAWYQQALADRPPDLRAFLAEVERFAQEVYAPVLLKGHRATEAERQTVLAGLARYTGVSADYWDKADLRIDEAHFAQELLRNRGRITGRIDARYSGGIFDPLSETFLYDPYDSAVGPAIVATFNDYYREELKVDSDRQYVVSGRVGREWDSRHQQPDQRGEGKVPFENTAVDLALAMTRNPRMKVLVLQGYFDLACPYPATNYFVDHLAVARELRANVTVSYYEAGHMMYVHPPSMAQFRKDLSEFVSANSR